jgi:NTP pyrophosphatase (non-canonical NTP hydrolase)
MKVHSRPPEWATHATLATMDIEQLQKRLRDFAAARQWQPYQTPKNLAMAMVVEAAELVEIFQWLTPEQSLALKDDAARHQHLGEEIADVMLYLLQIADQSGVDVEAAIERKLAMNALKYPAA